MSHMLMRIIAFGWVHELPENHVYALGPVSVKEKVYAFTLCKKTIVIS